MVLLVAGLLISTLVLNLTALSDNPLKQQRQRLAVLLRQLHEQAILSAAGVGVSISPSGEVQFFSNDQGRWQRVDGERSLQIADDIRWRLSRGTAPSRNTDQAAVVSPQILFSPEGLVSPFLITLSQASYPDELLDDQMFYPRRQRALSGL